MTDKNFSTDGACVFDGNKLLWGVPYPHNHLLPWDDNSLLPRAIMV